MSRIMPELEILNRVAGVGRKVPTLTEATL